MCCSAPQIYIFAYLIFILVYFFYLLLIFIYCLIFILFLIFIFSILIYLLFISDFLFFNRQHCGRKVIEPFRKARSKSVQTRINNATRGFGDYEDFHNVKREKDRKGQKSLSLE